MTRGVRIFAAAVLLGTASACASPATPSVVAPTSGVALSPSGVALSLSKGPRIPSNVRLCNRAVLRDEAWCTLWLRTDVGGAIAGGYHGSDIRRSLGAPTCGGAPPYCPNDLQAAYRLGTAARTGGKNSTVAIVVAYGYATAEADLAVYRSTMKLPPCTTSNGCLRIVNQKGQTSPLPSTQIVEWLFEAAQDLDTVSAICPNCKIVLVEANDQHNRNLASAENAAVRLGATEITNSYAVLEYEADNPAYDHPGITITASAGDGGAIAAQPCTFANVVCVGGTTLTRARGTARGWNEIAWFGTGSGCSTFVSKPAWQTDKGCSMRTDADISADADSDTGVAFYGHDGPTVGGWLEGGGTSVSSPLVAAAFALASGTGNVPAPQFVWQHGGGSSYNDVVTGSNPGIFTCTTIDYYICNARPGYDGPTGWGTPSGIGGL